MITSKRFTVPKLKLLNITKMKCSLTLFIKHNNVSMILHNFNIKNIILLKFCKDLRKNYRNSCDNKKYNEFNIIFLMVYYLKKGITMSKYHA